MRLKRQVSFLLACLLLLSCGLCSAATYQVTEQEMQQLSSNSQRLSEINAILQLGSTESQKTLLKVSAELKASQAELQTLKQELAKLQDSLQIAKSLSQSQQDLLTQTNESFRQYASEQKKAQARIKTERTLWMIVAGVAGYFAVTK
jgi:hypothetical protein